MKGFAWIVVAAATGLGAPAVRDLDGRLWQPFAPQARATLLLFVTSDCPISNAYAPEIGDVCRAYRSKGIDCLLLYEDAGIAPAGARAHRDDFRLAEIPAAIDGDRALARAAGASVTPEAVLVDSTGAARYRGRIDNLYADLGRRRPAATVHDLREAIDALLAGRPIARPRTEALGCYITPSPGRSKESR